jgi:hypothetical protein
VGYADLHFAAEDAQEAVTAFLTLVVFVLAAAVLVLVAAGWGTWLAGRWIWRKARDRDRAGHGVPS